MDVVVDIVVIVVVIVILVFGPGGSISTGDWSFYQLVAVVTVVVVVAMVVDGTRALWWAGLLKDDSGRQTRIHTYCGRTDKQTDGQTARQTDVHAHNQTYTHT